MSGFLYFIVQIKLSSIGNHTLFIFYGISHALCPVCLRWYVCLHMYVPGCFNVVCVSVGELFHAVHNEIRPTPCSLLSGLYLSNRLAQVISLLWRLVSAKVQLRARAQRHVDERGRDRPDRKRAEIPVPNSL